MFRGDLFALTDLFFLSVNLQHSGFSISSVSIGRLFIINVPRVFSGERIPYFYFSECRGGRNDDASSITSAIDHSQFAALRVKDAIVDQFRRRFGRRPNVE